MTAANKSRRVRDGWPQPARLALSLWRAVEAQHVASTMRLAAGAGAQDMLERIIEASKPPLPESVRTLHYLLSTPFRYPSPYGSRFRAATDPGVWYGADERRAACAELGYWRWRFLRDSEGLQSLGPSPQTVFSTRVRTCSLDLRVPPLRKQRAQWMHSDNYAPCQALAVKARKSDIGMIRYASVRDPQHGGCGAVLRPDAFVRRQPLKQETWFLGVDAEGAVWRRDKTAFTFVFDH